ncbi:hypothetical protein MKZ38_001096 [Zalerion maritima]|uniref:Uncharacterized protein n=1 Tax=Zalerion maritima TaxID=339359 RepID=A0AAD5WTC2_9PEZI|nr:hypothetical protein MKZ38_001096 [Zalerion maritima]
MTTAAAAATEIAVEIRKGHTYTRMGDSIVPAAAACLASRILQLSDNYQRWRRQCRARWRRRRGRPGNIAPSKQGAIKDEPRPRWSVPGLMQGRRTWDLDSRRSNSRSGKFVSEHRDLSARGRPEPDVNYKGSTAVVGFGQFGGELASWIRQCWEKDVQP